MPFLFLSGGTAQFTKHISWTIIFALTFSLIESFFILPAHLSHLKEQNKDGVFYKLQSFFADGLLAFARNVYQPIIKLAITMRYFTVVTFIGFFMISFALLSQGWISFKFQPELQGTFVSLVIRMPEGSPWARSEQIFEQVQGAANRVKEKLDTPDLEYVESIFVGAEEGSVDSYLTIIPAEDRKESTKEVAEMFRDEVGDIEDAEEVTIGYTLNNDLSLIHI